MTYYIDASDGRGKVKLICEETYTDVSIYTPNCMEQEQDFLCKLALTLLHGENLIKKEGF